MMTRHVNPKVEIGARRRAVAAAAGAPPRLQLVQMNKKIKPIARREAANGVRLKAAAGAGAPTTARDARRIRRMNAPPEAANGVRT